MKTPGNFDMKTQGNLYLCKIESLKIAQLSNAGSLNWQVTSLQMIIDIPADSA